MGKQQFPTYHLLDDIKAVVDQTQDNVDSLKNTDIGNLNTKIGAATDAAGTETVFGKLAGANWWDKYKPMLYESNISPPVSTWTQVVNVTGKGFLSDAVINSNAGGWEYRIRVTIDGLLYFEAITSGADKTSGIVQANHLIYHDSYGSSMRFGIGASLGQAQTFVQLPYTAGGMATGILQSPKFFNASLLVEVQTAAAVSMRYSVLGGVV